MANSYNLKVSFLNGNKWDLDILAEDISWINCFIDATQYKQATEINIKLIENNVPNTENFTGAKSIKSNI